MKKSRSAKIGTGFLSVLIFLIAICFLLPFVVMVVSSLKPEEAIFDPLFPPSFQYLDNYKAAFSSPTFVSSFFNSIIVCVVTLLCLIVLASLAGYAVSRSNKRIFKITYVIFAITLIIPMQANMVFLYRLGTAFSLINTLAFLILINVSGNISYSSLIYSGFVKSIPKEIEEAALIDGCGTFSSFFNIVFPLLRPATGTVIVIELLWYWNDYQGPLIYLPGGQVKTLMLEISQFRSYIQNTSFLTTAWAPVSAICVIATLPVVIFFICTQKNMLKGLTAGSVKG